MSRVAPFCCCCSCYALSKAFLIPFLNSFNIMPCIYVLGEEKTRHKNNMNNLKILIKEFPCSALGYSSAFIHVCMFMCA